MTDMELTTHLRLTERRLRAALRQLRPTHRLASGHLMGDALIARDMLRTVRQQRRDASRRSPWFTGPNGFGPQIDLVCRYAGRT